MVEKYASRFQLLMALKQGSHVVSFNGDEDCGLYLTNFVNDFGTPLAARGTREELEALVEELRR